MAFDPIVASGHRSALPHARPGHHVLREGDPVLLDFGCVVDGYASDMTRMVCIGRPPEGFEQVCAVIEEALATAFEAARTGIAASALDEAARNVIDAAGFGPAFSHSLGHGVGLEVHEWPSVSGRNEALLPDSCVVTLEPGIYLDGRFGVRIEDLVWLKPDGAENLTSLSRSVVYL